MWGFFRHAPIGLWGKTGGGGGGEGGGQFQTKGGGGFGGGVFLGAPQLGWGVRRGGGGGRGVDQFQQIGKLVFEMVCVVGGALKMVSSWVFQSRCLLPCLFHLRVPVSQGVRLCCLLLVEPQFRGTQTNDPRVSCKDCLFDYTGSLFLTRRCLAL